MTITPAERERRKANNRRDLNETFREAGVLIQANPGVYAIEVPDLALCEWMILGDSADWEGTVREEWIVPFSDAMERIMEIVRESTREPVIAWEIARPSGEYQLQSPEGWMQPLTPRAVTREGYTDDVETGSGDDEHLARIVRRAYVEFVAHEESMGIVIKKGPKPVESEKAAA